MFSKKPFHKDNGRKILLSTFAQILLQICGMGLASVSLYLLADTMIPAFENKAIVISMVVIVILSTLEVAKYVIWKDLFLVRYKTDKLDVSTLLISIFLFILSSTSSSIGAYQIASTITDSTSILEKRKDKLIAKIEREADAKVKELKTISNEIERQNADKIKRGLLLVIPEVEQTKIQNYQRLIQAYESEKTKKVAEIEDKTNSGSKVVKDISIRYAVVAFILSLIFELVAVLCIHYSVYFNYRIYLEGINVLTPKEEKQQIIIQAEKEEERKPQVYKPEVAQIGFVASNKKRNDYNIHDKESAMRWLESDHNGLKSSTRKQIVELLEQGVKTNRISEDLGVSRKTIMVAKMASEFL
jgi:hypothetical protein